MKKSLYLFTLLCCLFVKTLHSQQSANYTNQLTQFQEALVLYNSSQYEASSQLFNTLLHQGVDGVIASDCNYYAANCAIRLNKIGAEQLIFDFVKTYPESNKSSYAYVDVANFKFDSGNYKEALEWYKKVNQNMLSGNDREQYYFNFAYALYITGNSKQAKRYFTRVKDSNLYGEQAIYYIGYMAYQGDDYDTAEAFFDQIKDNNDYKDKLIYFQADLNFKKGRFELAIELAKSQLDKKNRSEISELSKIIGESYFNLNKYDEALPFLKNYKGKQRKWNDIDYYQLGYCYYQTKDYQSAISEFNKIIEGKDKVAQNAYYHLAESYLKENQKSQALNAFRNASQMQYNDRITSDAFLNYAKLSYEIGNAYEPVSNVLMEYLEAYPKSASKMEIENLLISSYIASKDYLNAIKLLRKIKRNKAQNLAYQKATFLHGIDLFNMGDLDAAKAFFQNSKEVNEDPKLTTQATFWLGDVYYKLKAFNLAEASYNEVVNALKINKDEAYEIVNYNLGYVYFKTKSYDNAINSFNKWLKNSIRDTDRLILNDTYVRIADCYFVSSKYINAVEFYNKAIEIGKSEIDYAQFQIAMSYGYMGDYIKKIKLLNQFLSENKTSKLRDDAIYDLANTYNKNGTPAKAISYYEILLKDYPESNFVSKVLLRQGLIYYNQSKSNEALVKLKTLAKNYPQSLEAQQAIATVKLIYIDQGEVHKYASWTKTLNYIEVTESELDNATYEAAEKQYLDGNTKIAIKQFNKYLSSYPYGKHLLKAHYYLSELYVKLELVENAIPHLEYVINTIENRYKEQSLLTLAQIHIDNNSWTKAISILEILENEASNNRNALYASANLMQAYYKTNASESAKLKADNILLNSDLDEIIKEDAHLILAKLYFEALNYELSKLNYKAIKDSQRSDIAVEASYYLAFFDHSKGLWELSNSKIQTLIKTYPNQKYFCSKALLLMAKNFEALKDAFQATYILENLITNFKDFDNVSGEAEEVLKQIKENEAKTNASIKIQE